MKDIYFEEHYGKLYEEHENGESKVFEFDGKYGKVIYMFIKRPIPQKINHKQYYDIITPYGYGGPLIVDYDESTKHLLIEEFNTMFKSYCEENNIVSEFVRFHPIEENVNDFEDVYETVYGGKTVGTNLADYDEPYRKEFSKSCRRDVRKAFNNNITYNIIEQPEEINKFLDIYYGTMDRKEASEYYYFDQEYFNKSIKYFQDNIILIEAIYEDEVISKGFYFVYGDYIHVHLSGTKDGYLKLGPEYVLNYAATIWGKENGYKLIHHGGGRTTSDDDSLLRNKKKYSRNTEFTFHIGKKIWNEEIYNELCEINQVDSDVAFFPAYRFSGN